MLPTSRIRPSFSIYHLLILWVGSILASPVEIQSAGPHYPSDFAMAPESRLLFTANRGSRSISVLDISSGNRIQELGLGPEVLPSRIIAYIRNGDLEIALSDEAGHSVRIFSWKKDSPSPLSQKSTLPVGRHPQGLSYHASTRQLLVACSEKGEVWAIDPDRKSPAVKIPTVEGARNLLLVAGKNSRERDILAVTGRQEIGLIDIRKKSSLGSTSLSVGRGLNISGLVSDNGNLFVSHQIQPTQVAVDPQMIVWGLILSNRITKVPLESLARQPDTDIDPNYIPGYEKVYGVKFEGGDPRHGVIPLDQRQRANGDPGAPALIRAGRGKEDLLLLPVGGTNRVLFIPTKEAYLPGTEPLSRQDALPSIPVGDRPVAVLADSARQLAYVLCSLEDSIWEIEIQSRKVLRKLAIGPPPASTPEHLGALIFFDSRRSRGGWYSCHSCHPEGGSRGHTFDTQADGDGLSKKAPDLHGVAFSGPWSWNGKFKTLAEQVEASLHSTMAVNNPPPEEDVANLVAFLESLQHKVPPAPAGKLRESISRGTKVFDKAGCAHCHQPPLFTVNELKDVGVFDDFDGYRHFNPPSLLRVRSRSRYLHDGRAKTLRSVFSSHNPENKHGKAHALSKVELEDLIAYLNSL